MADELLAVMSKRKNEYDKKIYGIFFFTIVFFICPYVSYVNDFSEKAILVFREQRKLNDEWIAAVKSGHNDLKNQKGELLQAHRENECTNILRSLEKEYCANPRNDLLKEFIETLINGWNSAYEYPDRVFAVLFACDPERLIKGIISLNSKDQKIICGDLDWGFRNITYKKEDSFPNFIKLTEKLNKLKSMILTDQKK